LPVPKRLLIRFAAAWTVSLAGVSPSVGRAR
jgi:hypothetical protein